MVKLETLFGLEILDTYIMHIPHSSMNIPSYSGYIMENLNEEMHKLTDKNTAEIFYIDDVTTLIFPYSRLFCDVERLPDDIEPMFEFGRGYFYTKTDNGKLLRVHDDDLKHNIYEKYYMPHHNKLKQLVDEKLEAHNVVHIMDCHSFSDVPLETDIDKNTKRADVCIGVDDFHTPHYMVEKIKSACRSYNYSFEINSPYSGTIVPLEYYQKKSNVCSVMVEINRKLYEKNSIVDYNKISILNQFVRRILTF